MSLPQSSSSPGRLAPLPFALSVFVVYLLSFGSQVLLSAPVTDRLSVLPFALAQAFLIVVWFVLHRRRLYDAGRPAGLAIGIAIMYALEVALVALAIWLILESAGGSTGGAGQESTMLKLFVFLYFLSLLNGDPTFSVLQIWIVGFLVVMALPVVIALCYSIWAGTRPTVRA